MASNQQTNISSEQLIHVGIRVPTDLHKVIKKLAVDLDKDAQDIYVEGARWYVERNRKKGVA